MVLTYPELVNQKVNQAELEQAIVNIQKMLDSQKRKSNQQIIDDAGRKICALLLPKEKHVQ